MKTVARNNREAYDMAATMTPFRNSRGSLSGKWYSYVPVNPADRGHANADFRHALAEAIKDRETFVIFSYATPIGFIRNGVYVEDGQKFSVTTSKHQGGYRAGMHKAGIEVKTIDLPK